MSIYNENEIRITGSIAKEPEFRESPSGDAWLKLTVPTQRNWRDESGQNQSHTEWHTVILKGNDAINARNYLTKGSYVTIKGELRYRKWKDSNQQDRISAEIHAFKVGYLDRKNNAVSAEQTPSAVINDGIQENHDAYRNLEF